MHADTWISGFVLALSRRTCAFRSPRDVGSTFLEQFVAALSRATPAFTDHRKRGRSFRNEARRREDHDRARVQDVTRPPTRSSAEAARAAPEPADVRALVVTPRTFNDAQQIADRFKDSVPVVLKVQGIDPDLAKRLIDFASGLTYALDGTMQRVADKVFVLVPQGVAISTEQRSRLVAEEASIEPIRRPVSNSAASAASIRAGRRREM